MALSERLTFEEHGELEQFDGGAALVSFVEAESLLDQLLFLLLGLSHMVVFLVKVTIVVVTLPLISSPTQSDQRS